MLILAAEVPELRWTGLEQVNASNAGWSSLGQAQIRVRFREFVIFSMEGSGSKPRGDSKFEEATPKAPLNLFGR
jgi:hypothetical protein